MLILMVLLSQWEGTCNHPIHKDMPSDKHQAED